MPRLSVLRGVVSMYFADDPLHAFMPVTASMRPKVTSLRATFSWFLPRRATAMVSESTVFHGAELE